MRKDLLKLKSLSVDAILSRLKILDSYLVSFPSPDNKSFSQGEISEILLIILHVV